MIIISIGQLIVMVEVDCLFLRYDMPRKIYQSSRVSTLSLIQNLAFPIATANHSYFVGRKTSDTKQKSQTVLIIIVATTKGNTFHTDRITWGKEDAVKWLRPMPALAQFYREHSDHDQSKISAQKSKQ